MNTVDEEKMVKMVNEDLLPFFDDYNPSEFKSVDEYEVTKLIGEDGKVFVFETTKQGHVGIWKDYFIDPEQWKHNRLRKWQGLTY